VICQELFEHIFHLKTIYLRALKTRISYVVSRKYGVETLKDDITNLNSEDYRNKIAHGHKTFIKGSNRVLPKRQLLQLSSGLITNKEYRQGLGLTESKSVSNEYITICEVVVDVERKPMRKKHAKTYTRIRRHKIPDYIQKLIDDTNPLQPSVYHYF